MSRTLGINSLSVFVVLDHAPELHFLYFITKVTSYIDVILDI